MAESKCSPVQEQRVKDVNTALESLTLPPCSNITTQNGTLKAVRETEQYNIVLEIAQNGHAYIHLENCKKRCTWDSGIW